MSATNRSCARCKSPLTAARRNRRKKYCGRCEPVVKRETKQKAHDRRVTRNGFTGEDYWRLFEAQGCKCAIKNCRCNGRTKFLSVDHDHKCDKGHDPKDWCRSCVRRLVCSRHNSWLGQSGDDATGFYSLADYLRNPPARRILK